ncbi:MAG: Tfp pilus assembly protein FimT/FimU [Aestuariibacter sp.]
MIELLVAMVVISLALTIVGGATTDSIAKYRLKSQQVLLTSVIKKASREAFLWEQPLELVFQENLLIVQGANATVLNRYEFSELKFDNQKVIVNRGGHTNKKSLDYVANGNLWKFDVVAKSHEK